MYKVWIYVYEYYDVVYKVWMFIDEYIFGFVYRYFVEMYFEKEKFV